jgi:hypothetical protein
LDFGFWISDFGFLIYAQNTVRKHCLEQPEVCRKSQCCTVQSWTRHDVLLNKSRHQTSYRKQTLQCQISIEAIVLLACEHCSERSTKPRPASHRPVLNHIQATQILPQLSSYTAKTENTATASLACLIRSILRKSQNSSTRSESEAEQAIENRHSVQRSRHRKPRGLGQNGQKQGTTRSRTRSPQAQHYCQHSFRSPLPG